MGSLSPMRVQRVLLAALTLGAVAFAAVPTSPASATTVGTGPQPAFLTGTGNGTAPHVQIYTANGGAISGFFAHANNTGARVAAGDLDGDLEPELITAEGPGAPSHVVVRKMNGTVVGSFSPYGGFPGGVNVAAGDVDGDTKAELITAADSGGGPHVIVWDMDTPGNFVQRYGWFAYDAGFKGGVRIAVADVTGSTKADVVTAPGAGGGPHVRVWDLGSGAAVEHAGWFAYGPSFTGGVSVSAGELDGTRAVVTGAGPGGGPHVRVFSTSGSVKKEFYAYAANFTGGVNVMLSTAQGGDLGHIVTAPASWGGPHIRALTSSGGLLFEFMAYGGHPINGVTLGAVPQLGVQNNTNQSGGSNSSFGG